MPRRTPPVLVVSTTSSSASVHSEGVVVDAKVMVDQFSDTLARIAACDTEKEMRAAISFAIATVASFKTETRTKFKTRLLAYRARRAVPHVRARTPATFYTPTL